MMFVATETHVPLENLVFPAVIDAYSTDNDLGEYRYAWTEQQFSPFDGTYRSANPARSGTVDPDNNYATEINGEFVAAGTLVWMRLKGVVGGKFVYEFQAINYDQINLTYNETPTGTVDGVNTTFVLSGTPDDGAIVTRNGIIQQPGVDYTLVNDTITFLVVPQTGDIILVSYGSSGRGGATNVTIVYAGASSLTLSGTTVLNVNSSASISINNGGSLTLVAGGSVYFNGGTVYFAGASISISANTTLTIGGGVSWTWSGGGTWVIDISAWSWISNTTITIAASKTVTISGSSSSLWHFGAPLKICDWQFTCYYVDYTWGGGVYTRPASTTTADRKPLYILAGAGTASMTGMTFAGDGQVVSLFNNGSGTITLLPSGFITPNGLDYEMESGCGVLVVNTSVGALLVLDSQDRYRSPLTTEGDLLSHDGADEIRLPAHTNTDEVRYLAQTEGADEVPYWSTIDLSATAGGLSGVLGVTYGGTGLSSCTKGDTLYASAANTWARLAANGTATRKFLSQTNDDAPVWEQPAFTNITGTATTSQIPTACLRWTKIPLNYANFSAAATSNAQVIMAGVAKRFIHQIIVKVSSQWAGGAGTSVTYSIGTDATGYSNIAAGGTLRLVTPGDTVFDMTATVNRMVPDSSSVNSFAATDIYMKVTSTGANLDQYTSGAVDVWILESILP